MLFLKRNENGGFTDMEPPNMSVIFSRGNHLSEGMREAALSQYTQR